MTLELKKSDQETVKKVASEFINFYYNCLNNKSYDEICKYLKKFTTISADKIRYLDNDLLKYYQMFQNIEAEFSNIAYDTLHSGAKRINILVSGIINFNNNGDRSSRQFTEYIHCGSSKEGEFWIQTIIFKLI